MGEAAIPRNLFIDILRLIADLRPRRWREAFDCYAFKVNRQENCVQMPEKLTAFGATQSGPMKSTLSIRDGGGSALPKKPNGGRFVPNTAFIWGF